MQLGQSLLDNELHIGQPGLKLGRILGAQLDIGCPHVGHARLDLRLDNRTLALPSLALERDDLTERRSQIIAQRCFEIERVDWRP